MLGSLAPLSFAPGGCVFLKLGTPEGCVARPRLHSTFPPVLLYAKTWYDLQLSAATKKPFPLSSK